MLLMRSCTQRYAQLLPATCTGPQSCVPSVATPPPGFALHPEAGRYFSALAKGGACYLLNDWVRHCYPDDPEQ